MEGGDETESWLCPPCLVPTSASEVAPATSAVAPSLEPQPQPRARIALGAPAPAQPLSPASLEPPPRQAPGRAAQPHPQPDEDAQVWSQEFRQFIRRNEQLTIRPVDDISLAAFPRLKKALTDDPDRSRKLGVIARLLATFMRDLNIRVRTYWPWLEALSLCDPNPANRIKNKAKLSDYVTILLTRFPWSNDLREKHGDADAVQLSAYKYFAMDSSDAHYSKPDDQPAFCFARQREERVVEMI